MEIPSRVPFVVLLQYCDLDLVLLLLAPLAVLHVDKVLLLDSESRHLKVHYLLVLSHLLSSSFFKGRVQLARCHCIGVDAGDRENFIH